MGISLSSVSQGSAKGPALALGSILETIKCPFHRSSLSGCGVLGPCVAEVVVLVGSEQC